MSVHIYNSTWHYTTEYRMVIPKIANISVLSIADRWIVTRQVQEQQEMLQDVCNIQ
jgi:hypothetical protein